MIYFSFVVLTLLFPFIASECPNGCSRNGNCGSHDQCTCSTGYMGNDCSQQICPFGHAHTDTPKGDLNMDGASTTASAVSITTPMYPTGTYEGFPTAGAGFTQYEAHYYMECSNNGICDRTTGVCDCFAAYEGSSCQRQICPNSCSNKGTCESMGKLADKADGTLFGNVQESGEKTYNLWDADLLHGCLCDPWYSGPDCSLRQCKVGVDPFYSDSHDPIYDRFMLVIGATSGDNAPTAGSAATFTPTTSTFRLQMYDYHGEGYLTETITLPVLGASGDCNLCAGVQAAIRALPNDPFPNAVCSEPDATASWYTLYSDGDSEAAATLGNAHFLTCSLVSVPGRLRLPELIDVNIVGASTALSMITGTSQRGEDQDWTPTLATTVNIAVAGMDTSTNLATDLATILAATDEPILIRIKDQYLVMTALAALVWGWPLDAATGENLYYAPSGTLTESDTPLTWAVGATSFTADAAATLVRGNWFIFANQIFKVTAISGTTVTVDRPYMGDPTTGARVDTGTVAGYLITPPSTTTTYVDECAFKGICDRTTGLCGCFTGYTDDDCGTQNALAE